MWRVYVNLMTGESPNDLKIFSKQLPDKDAAVLMGFPGSGLVGTIALQYMVEQTRIRTDWHDDIQVFPPARNDE